MPYNDATVPIPPSPDHPTWPVSRSGRPPRLPQTGVRVGCGLALAIIGSFVAGLILSALIFSPHTVPNALPSTPASKTGVFKITVTDTFLNEALNASGNGTLSNIQTHIQPNGQLTISGIVHGAFIGSGQQGVVVLAPSVSQGKLVVNPVSGAVAGFPLPGLALDPIAKAVNQQLAQTSGFTLGNGQRMTAQSVSFGTGEMTISYA
ncbi:MAG TPA: hypothetical protein VFQ25_14765 [Ktedonobacterales bacterium]|nr:hypothetical protein [Ktedonobacterales bacterium]